MMHGQLRPPGTYQCVPTTSNGRAYSIYCFRYVVETKEGVST